ISLAFFTLAGFSMDQVCQMMEPLIQRPIDDTLVEPFTHELIRWFRTLDAQAVAVALETVKTSAQGMLEFASQYDVLLCPTLAIEPPKLGYLSPSLNREVLIERTERFAAYTPIHNISGMCAMSVPLSKSRKGLPIGSHFAAMPGDEAKLFSLAYELEEASPWRMG
ncbi:MAG: amidase family protein, partial [Gammaproteobacteria bacterium]|nr:amidase family protein [Gammaproteobacteria bacterium]